MVSLGPEVRGWLSGMGDHRRNGTVALFWTEHVAEPANRTGREQSVEAFERRLKVLRERNSHVIAIDFTSTDPDWAALAANRLAQLYVQSQYEQKRENTNRTLAWLSGWRVDLFVR